MKRISVVIVTRDRCGTALDCVAHALALWEQPAVVVVDNGSTDGTAEAIKRRHPQAKLVRLPFDLGVVARNVGLDRAETPYVAYCGDDVRWEPGALAAACGLLDMHPRVGLVAPRALAGAAIVRRAAFVEVGGFDPGSAADDAEARLASDFASEGWELVHVDGFVARQEAAEPEEPSAAPRFRERVPAGAVRPRRAPAFRFRSAP